VSAEATLALVNETLESGQASDAGRAHLGGSIIGRDCTRELWFTFRWATQSRHPARLLRIFARGHREEAVFNDYLRKAGLTVWEEDPDIAGQQWHVDAVAGHFGGSLDGVVVGIVGDEQTPYVSEQKTMSAKVFKQVSTKGVRAAKPEHWAQMQIYMHLFQGVSKALYQAVNKNNDELHYEVVEHDPDAGEQLLNRAERIITTDFPMSDRISDDPAYFACGWCDHHSVCYQLRAPQSSCRSCTFSTPELDGDGRWSCRKHGRDLSLEDQRVGCSSHLFIPTFLAPRFEAIDADEDQTWVRYRNRETGSEWVNGAGGFSSEEVAACEDLNALGQEWLDQLRNRFDGKVIA
jgi:hypothetical protein